MAYPTDVVSTGDLITAAQINRWMVMLADTTLTGVSSVIRISSIPAHWAHQWVVADVRGDSATTDRYVDVLLNDDGAANYDSLIVVTKAGPTTTTDENLGATFCRLAYMPAATATASTSSAFSMLIPQYAGTTFRKTMDVSGTYKTGETTGLIRTQRAAGWWRSTAAVTVVSLTPSAGNFDIGTRVSLYGMGRI